MTRSKIACIEEIDAIKTEHHAFAYPVFCRSIYNVVSRDALALCYFALSGDGAHIAVVTNAEVEFPTWKLHPEIGVGSVTEDKGISSPA